MSVSIQLDTIENCELEMTLEYKRQFRSFKATGVPTNTPAGMQGSVVDALAALSPAVFINAAHPINTGVYSGMLVKDIRILRGTIGAEGDGIVDGLIEYRYDTPQSQSTGPLTTLPSLHCTLEQDQTDTDKDGNRMEVFYWSDRTKIGNLASVTDKQPAISPFYRPLSTMVFSKFVIVKTDAEATALMSLKSYMGKLNSVAFKGADPLTVICWDLQIDPISVTKTEVIYKITGVFVEKPEGWLSWSQYLDPYTGKAPKGTHKSLDDPGQVNPTWGSNGWAGFYVQGEADLNGLGL